MAVHLQLTVVFKQKKLIEGQLKTSRMYFFYSFLGHVIEETHRTAVELKMEQDCNLK